MKTRVPEQRTPANACCFVETGSLFLLLCVFCENLPVVVGVFHAASEVAEETDGVMRSADHKPDSRDESGCHGDGKEGDPEVGVPPALRPALEEVPDERNEEGQNEVVEEEREDRPGNDSVAAGVFRGDADHLVEDQGLDGEFRLSRGDFVFSVAVLASVEKLVEVEGFVEDEREGDIPDDGEHD